MLFKHGWMRRFHDIDSNNRPLLLIFPHAGASASWYRQFSQSFSAHFEVIAFQYPGRQDRRTEPALTSLKDIAAGAFSEFRTSAFSRGAPIITFGHSLGAHVSFEFARLAEADGVAIRQLTVVAAVAPHRLVHKPSAPRNDQDLLQHLSALGGIDASVVADPDMVQMILPVLKADHCAAETYRCDPDTKVSARIRVLGGDIDPIVTMADLQGWRAHSDDVEVTMFDGGHFFLTDNVTALHRLLADEVIGR